MNLPRKFGGRGWPKHRRDAAERLLDEAPGGGAGQLLANDSAEFAQELSAMTSLLDTLKQVPGEAWNAELGTARAASRGSRVRGGGGFRPLAAAFSLVGVCLVAAFLAGSLTHPTLSGLHAHPAGKVSASAHVVLRPLPGVQGGGLAVAYMRGSDQMLLRVKRLPRSAPATYYELWLMTSNTDLVPVASFRLGRRGSGALDLVLPDDPSRYRFLDISVQHVGGGVTISQDNVLRGAIHS